MKVAIVGAGSVRTAELLEQLVASKRNLADTLVSKGEEAAFNEPFDDLVQKAADYIPKTYIFVDQNGREVVGTLVEQETIFDADVNDVREGKVFASDTGVKTGEKFIPSYNTTEGTKIIRAGRRFEILLEEQDKYDYTQMQAIICPFNSTLANSVSAEKVAIKDNLYNVQTTIALATITKNKDAKMIDFGIVNDTDQSQIIRYFTYKEIY